jgi:hypothetical protein
MIVGLISGTMPSALATSAHPTMIPPMDSVVISSFGSSQDRRAVRRGCLLASMVIAMVLSISAATVGVAIAVVRLRTLGRHLDR